jgi:hypothetical protein
LSHLLTSTRSAPDVGSGYLNAGDVLLAAGVEASLRAAREALLDLRVRLPDRSGDWVRQSRPRTPNQPRTIDSSRPMHRATSADVSSCASMYSSSQSRNGPTESTSVEPWLPPVVGAQMIDRTYGHLAAGADAWERELLDGFDERGRGTNGRYTGAENETEGTA